jgi:hypothetical protein
MNKLLLILLIPIICFGQTIGGADANNDVDLPGDVNIAGALHVTGNQACHGEMWMYESSGELTVAIANQYYAVNGVLEAGELCDWTFVAGSNGSGAITNSGGTAINIADTDHGLISGDYVNVQSVNHMGSSVVTYVDANNFTVAIAYVGDEACTWDEGDYLLAGATAAGRYLMNMSFSGSSGAQPSKEYKIEGVINSTHIDEIAIEIITTANLHNGAGSSALITVAAGDRVWTQIKNTQDTQNFSYEHANINLHRI